jgi:hypothetical protein
MVSWGTLMLSSSGYCLFSHSEICSGDQSRISYSQRPLATSGAGQEGTSSVAKRTPRHGHPPHGLDRPEGYRGEKSPGSPSRPLDRGDWLSHESTNRKRSLAKCPLARVSANRNLRVEPRLSAGFDPPPNSGCVPFAHVSSVEFCFFHAWQVTGTPITAILDMQGYVRIDAEGGQFVRRLQFGYPRAL